MCEFAKVRVAVGDVGTRKQVRELVEPHAEDVLVVVRTTEPSKDAVHASVLCSDAKFMIVG
jgi:hypothetical protein